MKKINSIFILILVIFNFITRGKVYDLANFVSFNQVEKQTEKHTQDHEDKHHTHSFVSASEDHHTHIYPEHCHHGTQEHHPLDSNNHAHKCQHLSSEGNYYISKIVPAITLFYNPDSLSFFPSNSLYLSISLDHQLRPPINA